MIRLLRRCIIPLAGLCLILSGCMSNPLEPETWPRSTGGGTKRQRPKSAVVAPAPTPVWR